MELLKVNNVKKIYNMRLRSRQCVALKQISFEVNQGEFIAIMVPPAAVKLRCLTYWPPLTSPQKVTYCLTVRATYL